ncbi:MAG TPA: hypothetical protein VNH44_02430, partial [Micropepsaceae bacterium]|nr:hypothetical protein [Micropepsaceae bacterium]
KEAPKPFAVTPPNEPLHMKAPFAPQPASVAPATRNAKAPNPRGAAPPGDPPPPAPSDKPRRLMVSLTPGEYETLGIIGVKKNTTRHQLLRNALDEYLALLVEEFSGDCQCIYSGGSCSNSCSTSL